MSTFFTRTRLSVTLYVHCLQHTTIGLLCSTLFLSSSCARPVEAFQLSFYKNLLLFFCAVKRTDAQEILVNLCWLTLTYQLRSINCEVPCCVFVIYDANQITPFWQTYTYIYIYAISKVRFLYGQPTYMLYYFYVLHSPTCFDSKIRHLQWDKLCIFIFICYLVTLKPIFT